MNKPKVRFKGFEGEWEEKKLGEVCINFKYGINAAAKAFDGENKYLRITDIDDKSHSFLQNSLTTPDVDLSICDEYIMREGDIAVARTGASVGKSYIYHAKDGKVYFAGFLIRMQLNDCVNKDFVYLNTLTSAFSRYIDLVSQRSGQPGVNAEELKAYKFRLAPSLPEQRRIASYFTHLDTLIEASRQKVEKLKQVKAASLQSLFPTHGERVPKIRFKGCEGEWKVVKLGELYERRNERNDLSYGVDKIISVANMYYRADSVVSSLDYLRSYNIFKVGDIAFEGNKSKNFAHGRFVENSIGDGIVSHVFVVLKRRDNEYDLNFWKYYINNESIMGAILGRCTKSSTMMNDIVVDEFFKESVLVPSLEEQQKIGKYLNTIDTLLTLERARYAKLQQVKRASLTQMFV